MRRLIVLACTLLLAGSAATAQRGPEVRRTLSPVRGEYVVVLRDASDPEAVGREAAGLYGGRLTRVYREALRGFAIQMPEAVAGVLARDARVAYVEENGLIRAAEFVDAWGLDRIDQRLLPLDGRYAYTNQGTGVTVHLLDSGVRFSHREFAGRAVNAGDFVGTATLDDDASGAAGQDCHGHGTHVAGVVGGREYGVAKNVTLHSYRVLGCSGVGRASDAIAALEHIIATHRKPAVVNISLEVPGLTALDDAVRRTIGAGVTVVVAAGNQNATVGTHSPGRVPEAITVAATTAVDARASFSNFGWLVDLFAPGEHILAAHFASDAGLASASGTSVAAPHVAGVAALFLETHPWASPAQVRDRIVEAGTRGVIAGTGAGTPNVLLFSGFDLSPAPALVIQPALLSFSAVPVGAVSEVRTIAVTNPGTAPLRVSTATLAGPHAGDFRIHRDDCRSATVAVGAHCLVHLTFSPRGEGPRSGRVSVTSNASGGPHEAMLGGEGLAATTSGAPPGAPWRSADIGHVGTAGSATSSGAGLRVRASGGDVWGAADAFHYVYQPLSGDGVIVARVAGLEGQAAWTKAGVMMRETLEPGSAHAFMLLSRERGIAFQRRTAAGGATTHTSGGAGVAPRWVRLARTGDTLTAAVSADGSVWTEVGRDRLDMRASVWVGLAVSSHSSSTAAAALFDGVSVEGASTLPPGWASSDIGHVSRPGTASGSGVSFTVQGSGGDIWGTADGFHYTYRPLVGDGTVVARVATLHGREAWTKAGVMIRGTLQPDSAHALMLVSTGKGLAFQRRTADQRLSSHTSVGAGMAPRWVRLTRAGPVITASVSPDGVSWTTVGQDTFSMPVAVWVGLAVTSHGSAELASASFDGVAVTAAGWASRDVGHGGPAGLGSEVGGTFTLKGAGADIWSSSDGFHFMYRQLPGDGSIEARVRSLSGAHAWTKAGVMIRESLHAGSAHAFMLVSAAKGLAFQRRVVTDGPSTHTGGGGGEAPRWVRLTRSGQTIAAYTSTDGATWRLVGWDTVAMNGPVWVGLAVTSHDAARLATATFDGVSVW